MVSYKKIISTIIAILLLSLEYQAVAMDDDPPKRPVDKGKTGFGVMIMGGTYFSILSTKDDYFNSSDLSTHIYNSFGAGLVLDFPTSAKTRFWINPEFELVSLKRPLLIFNLTLQSFLSRSFYITYGGSLSIDNFIYGGAGPNLGLGIKAGRRHSFFIKSSLFYKKLPESNDLVKYNVFQVPVSLGYRIDLAATSRKSKPTAVSIPSMAPERAPSPPKQAEDQTINQPQKRDTIPPARVEEQKVIPQQQPDTIPSRPAEQQKTIQQPKPEPVPVKPATDKIINQPAGELTDYSYNELSLLLEKVIKEEDYLMAERIQKEMDLRESTGNFSEIPVKRLEEMIQEAVKAENYSRAALIQDEIDKRNK